MKQKALDFINKYASFIICTHEIPDADGIGGEILLSFILKKLGKKVKILNASPVPATFAFMDTQKIVKTWDAALHGKFLRNSALFVLDTSDEYNIGIIKDEVLPYVRDVLVIDHHELNPLSIFDGFVDSKASSTSEMVMNLALEYNISPDRASSKAAFAGIVYDTGSFAYTKTSANTFKVAAILAEKGVSPYSIYQELYESASAGAVILQKLVLSTLELYENGQIAVQILRKEDLESTGATIEDAESFINLPLKSKDVKVSILVKQNIEGSIRCSLRSKGAINVSKIAQAFSGGGHATAAGFRTTMSIEETLQKMLHSVKSVLNQP